MPQFHHATLDNGLQVIAELDSTVQSVAFGFFVRAGARDETDDVSGVSHFLEHMAFKGTEKFSAEDVNRVFDEVGAQYNAATGEESTMFYSAILPEYLPQTFELQAGILFPSLREADFDMEKQVILEEIGMYDDQPSFVAYDHAMRRFFAGHPLGRPILGSRESVGGLTAAQMRDYHSTHYRAGNITLAVAGRTDWETVLELAQRCCSRWPAGESPRTKRSPGPAPSSEWIVKESVQLEQVMALAAAPDGADPLRYAAELLSVIVGDDSSSRLYWELVDPGHAEVAEISYNDFEDAGTYLTYLSCEAEAVRENRERIRSIYAAINRDGITADELELARNKVCTRVVLRGERPMGRLSLLGGNWLTRREYRSVADDLRILRGITLDDMHRLIAEWPLEQTATVGVGSLTGE